MTSTISTLKKQITSVSEKIKALKEEQRKYDKLTNESFNQLSKLYAITPRTNAVKEKITKTQAKHTKELTHYLRMGNQIYELNDKLLKLRSELDLANQKKRCEARAKAKPKTSKRTSGSYIVYSKYDRPLISTGSLERARQHAKTFGSVFGYIKTYDKDGKSHIVK